MDPALAQVLELQLPCQKVYITQYASLFLEQFLISLSTLEKQEPWPICIQQRLLNEPCIVQNTEQLSRAIWLRQMSACIQDPLCKEYWDYSKSNISFLKESVNAKYHDKIRQVPIQFSSEWIDNCKRLFADTPKEYDFVFCGTMTPQRKQLLQKLQEKQSVLVIQSFQGFLHVVQESCRAKAILNLHADTNQRVFETIRCNLFLESGVPVFSETSLDTDPRAATFSLDDMSSLDAFLQKS